MENEVDTKDGQGKALSTVGTVVGVALIGIYLVLSVSQLSEIESSDRDWARRTQLLSGIETLAFAAAGAILGTTVQRRATRRAERDAAEAKRTVVAEKRRADANAVEAERGRAIVNLIQTKAGRGAPGAEGEPMRGAATRSRPANEFQELLDFAQRYELSPEEGPIP